MTSAHKPQAPQSTGVFETANKILSQFENFAEYTKGEVAAILASLDERQAECEKTLSNLTKNLIPAHQGLLLTGDPRFSACLEHMNALEQHILSTHQFLLRET